MNTIEKLQKDPVSRRAFLARMGAAGLGLAAVNLLQGCSGGSSSSNTAAITFPVTSLPGSNNNEKVLNYALTLEYLEADLYRQALNYASGRPLAQPLDSTPGSYSRRVDSGGMSAFETEAGFEYLRQFAYVEAAHAEFLEVAIPATRRVARNPKGYTFGTTPAQNLQAILTALLPLEETGVRAYLGAAPFITDFRRTGSIAQLAVAIYSTEARHSSALNYVLRNNFGPTPMSGDQRVTPNYPNPNTFEYFLSPTTVVSRIQPFIIK